MVIPRSSLIGNTNTKAKKHDASCNGGTEIANADDISSLLESTPSFKEAFLGGISSSVTQSINSGDIADCPSWTLLAGTPTNDHRLLDPAWGPLSMEYGFMGNPVEMMRAAQRLPVSLQLVMENLPTWHAQGTLHKEVLQGQIVDQAPKEVLLMVKESHQNEGSHDLLLIKSIVHSLAQAFVDCGQEGLKEPPPFSPAL